MKQAAKEKKLAGRVTAYERTLNTRGKAITTDAFHRPGSLKK